MSAPSVFVAGHRGLVGGAIVRALEAKGGVRILTMARHELDLRDQAAVRAFFHDERPEQVYLAAAKVGGIHANSTYPADFILDNLIIQCNVLEAALRAGTRKVLFLGSSCIYPRAATQPMPEEALLSGALEPTNEPYAVAKIAGIKICESVNRQFGASHGMDFRSVMPTNLYGTGDTYHPENSHVIPALIRRFHEAKRDGVPQVVIWGTGAPRREFLYVDDLARACLHVMHMETQEYARLVTPMRSHLNVGSGSDISIRELALLIGEVVGYAGDVAFDARRPDGAPRKLLDSSRLMASGWAPTVGLRDGLARAYADFLARVDVPTQAAR